MKKLLIITLSLTLPLFLNAQEKQKEVGLLFSNFDNFGLTYKTGTNKSMWRFNTLILNGSNRIEITDSLETESKGFGFSIQVGHELRTNISDNLEFRYGADLSFTYNNSEYDYDDKTIDNHDQISERSVYEPGFNFVVGLNYKINDHFILGAELLPSISYKTGTEKGKNSLDEYVLEKDISGFSYGLSNSSARLSLIYRF